ncbi:MAG TPA: YggS family pyridoxal phosphate-dependent enzyme [Acidobacteriota bacterium]|nr:YggS family pyridoxal phosphate-dependent enzyme [Acidobacteriota bacterium]
MPASTLQSSKGPVATQRPIRHPVNDIELNLKRVRDRIAETALACRRSPDEIILLAISKNFPAEIVTRAIDAGQYRFGENRVQEAEAKICGLHSDPRLEWHLVGHLQSNKARRAAELFSVIHSVDSLKLAMRLNEAGLAREKPVSILLQVDLGGEDTKFGIERAEVRKFISESRHREGLRLNGLMTMPPYFEDQERARPFFAELRQLRDSLELEFPGCLGQRHLSMGMSHDFVVAIQEGATIVRIGTAVFGERHYE